MVNILIIDDDSFRARVIALEITQDGVDIFHVTTKREALLKMTNQQYDLVILDIMLPDDAKTPTPSKDGGIDLLNQIENLNSIKKPHHIVGLTSGGDVYEQAKSVFDEKLIPLFQWNQGNDDWKTALKNKISYLIKIDRQTPKTFCADIAIITAVEAEFSSARALFDDWRSFQLPNDPYIYQTTVATINGQARNIVLAMLPEMGMTSASCFTTKIINTFNPQQVYMIGICGGVEGAVNLQDIVVASTSWDYGSGKIKPQNPSSPNTLYLLEPSPHQISINPTIESEIQTYKDEIISEIVDEWSKLNPGLSPISPKLHLSPMPSGASVICDEKIFTEIIRPQHRKCVALDMETYGVYFAIKNSSKKSIDFLSVKCVSDFANNNKNDDHHSTCCYISSQFLLKFLEKHL